MHVNFHTIFIEFHIYNYCAHTIVWAAFWKHSSCWLEVQSCNKTTFHNYIENYFHTVSTCKKVNTFSPHYSMSLNVLYCFKSIMKLNFVCRHAVYYTLSDMFGMIISWQIECMLIYLFLGSFTNSLMIDFQINSSS